MFTIFIIQLIICNKIRSKFNLRFLLSVSALILSDNFEDSEYNTCENSIANNNESIKDQANLQSEIDSDDESCIDENKGWDNIHSSFGDLTSKNQEIYIKNKMELKGLDTNPFLVNYFLKAILTSWVKIDVDYFLNQNLNTILNDQRNIQLNQHSFVRIRPLLLNNSNQSPFQSIIPFKPMNDFDLDDE